MSQQRYINTLRRSGDWIVGTAQFNSNKNIPILLETIGDDKFYKIENNKIQKENFK